MPWKETCAVKERVRFIDEWERGDLSMVALCRKYGISRQTGYKWVHRYQQLGCCAHALTDLSRMPHNHPWATDQELVDLVIRARKRWPNWGPVTLHQWLKRVNPRVPIPAPSMYEPAPSLKVRAPKRLQRPGSRPPTRTQLLPLS